MIPFTVDQFFEVFERYNLAVWPAQLLLYAAGILAIFLALKRRSDLSKSINFLLCLFWMWMGVVYHLWFFSSINVGHGVSYLLNPNVSRARCR